MFPGNLASIHALTHNHVFHMLPYHPSKEENFPWGETGGCLLQVLTLILNFIVLNICYKGY